MKRGIKTNPKNFSVLKRDVPMKLINNSLEIQVEGFCTQSYEHSPIFSGSDIEVNELGFNIFWLAKVWLTKPSIPFDSILNDEIGNRIKIKIKIKSENFR